MRCSGAESIAFYNGEKHEENCATLRLALLVAVARIRIIWSTFLSLWTNFYQHATILLPSLLTAPRYFEGKIEFGVITQVTFLVLQHLLQSIVTGLVKHLVSRHTRWVEILCALCCRSVLRFLG